MNPQLLIFDLDGTLVDSRADLAAGINHMREGCGLEPLPLDVVSGYVGNGVRKLVERSLQGTSVDVDAALQMNKEYYFSHATVHTTLYDGVAEGIPALKAAGHSLAVLTNKPSRPSRAILNYFQLDGFLDSIVGGDVSDQLKPEPGGILRCLEACAMEPSEAWMVGDHCTDLAAAENAGISSAFCRYGFGNERGYKPTEYFASFSELVGYFV
jgi:phosphoglycolate phosphatase